MATTNPRPPPGGGGGGGNAQPRQAVLQINCRFKSHSRERTSEFQHRLSLPQDNLDGLSVLNLKGKLLSSLDLKGDETVGLYIGGMPLEDTWTGKMMGLRHGATLKAVITKSANSSPGDQDSAQSSKGSRRSSAEYLLSLDDWPTDRSRGGKRPVRVPSGGSEASPSSPGKHFSNVSWASTLHVETSADRLGSTDPPTTSSRTLPSSKGPHPASRQSTRSLSQEVPDDVRNTTATTTNKYSSSYPSSQPFASPDDAPFVFLPTSSQPPFTTLSTSTKQKTIDGSRSRSNNKQKGAKASGNDWGLTGALLRADSIEEAQESHPQPTTSTTRKQRPRPSQGEASFIATDDNFFLRQDSKPVLDRSRASRSSIGRAGSPRSLTTSACKSRRSSTSKEADPVDYRGLSAKDIFLRQDSDEGLATSASARPPSPGSGTHTTTGIIPKHRNASLLDTSVFAEMFLENGNLDNPIVSGPFKAAGHKTEDDYEDDEDEEKELERRRRQAVLSPPPQTPINVYLRQDVHGAVAPPPLIDVHLKKADSDVIDHKLRTPTGARAGTDALPSVASSAPSPLSIPEFSDSTPTREESSELPDDNKPPTPASRPCSRPSSPKGGRSSPAHRSHSRRSSREGSRGGAYSPFSKDPSLPYAFMDILTRPPEASLPVQEDGSPKASSPHSSHSGSPRSCSSPHHRRASKDIPIHDCRLVAYEVSPPASRNASPSNRAHNKRRSSLSGLSNFMDHLTMTGKPAPAVQQPNKKEQPAKTPPAPPTDPFNEATFKVTGRGVSFAPETEKICKGQHHPACRSRGTGACVMVDASGLGAAAAYEDIMDEGVAQGVADVHNQEAAIMAGLAAGQPPLLRSGQRLKNRILIWRALLEAAGKGHSSQCDCLKEEVQACNPAVDHLIKKEIAALKEGSTMSQVWSRCLEILKACEDSLADGGDAEAGKQPILDTLLESRLHQLTLEVDIKGGKTHTVTITSDSDINRVTDDIILRGRLNPTAATSGLSNLITTMVADVCKEEVRSLRQDRAKLADMLQWAETLLIEVEAAQLPASANTSSTTTTPAAPTWDQKPGSLVSRLVMQLAVAEGRLEAYEKREEKERAREAAQKDKAPHVLEDDDGEDDDLSSSKDQYRRFMEDKCRILRAANNEKLSLQFENNRLRELLRPDGGNADKLYLALQEEKGKLEAKQEYSSAVIKALQNDLSSTQERENELQTQLIQQQATYQDSLNQLRAELRQLKGSAAAATSCHHPA